MLHALQAEFGYIDPSVISALADAVNVSRAEVYGVITFYRDFRTTPPEPGPDVRICRAEACQARGADDLVSHVSERMAFDDVYCLGNCALGPSVMIEGRVHGRVDAQRFDALLAVGR